MSATLDHLHRLYAHTDDPWNFNDSAYEQGKFIATRDALTRSTYRSALELGCGNGALAQHLVPRCARYTGLDAVERAVTAARSRMLGATFLQACYPCRLPDDSYDLVVLSEVLYFLSAADIGQLARDLTKAASGAEVICTTFMGDTGQALQGADALALFRTAMKSHLDLETVVDAGRYRIDRGALSEVHSRD